MRARWEELHAGLIRFITTLEADRQFVHARTAKSALARFDTASGLIEYLTRREADLDDKDLVYAALVLGVQRRTSWASFAMHALWCGLWPGLDAIYRRRLRSFRGEPDELVSAICTTFTLLVNRVDLQRVRRVAATLTRSTEREVMRLRQRTWTWAARRVQLKEVAESSRDAPGSVVDVVGLMTADSNTLTRRWLRSVVGTDADLFLAIVVGQSQRELAVQLGLSHQVLRKRLQRVRKKFAAAVSQFAAPTRVSEPDPRG
ncbi:MAG: hypothetical protein ACTHU0_24920 [Kofleriaceae bacterium]